MTEGMTEGGIPTNASSTRIVTPLQLENLASVKQMLHDAHALLQETWWDEHTNTVTIPIRQIDMHVEITIQSIETITYATERLNETTGQSEGL